MSFGQGVYNLGRLQNQFKLFLEMRIVLASIVPTEKIEEPLYGYVTSPRSIYGCGKCGACLFVHRVLQEPLNTKKTDKKRFFFAKKKMNLVPNKQLLVIAAFQSTNYRKNKNCV